MGCTMAKKKQNNKVVLVICSQGRSRMASTSAQYDLGLACLFVCVEVLRPSQPSGVMSSAVSLPNHTFTGQA